MLDPQMQERLNKQINEELYSAYLYLSMSAHFEAEGLSGFAHWMRMQWREEIEHALKIYGFIHDRDGRVSLSEIAQPTASFNSPTHAFEHALAHEQTISKKINELMDLATKLNDHATRIFLQWFVNEQVEEEALAREVVGKLGMVADNKPALLMLDRELGSRTSEG